MEREDLRQVIFPAMRIKQPIGEFFVGAMRANDLFRIANFDVRGLREHDGFAQYLGIQRSLNEKRVEEIKRYVNTMEATFPTAVILAVDERCAEIRELKCEDPDMSRTSLCVLRLRNIPDPEDGDEPVLFRQVARVLDGQHRIASLSDLDGKDFDVNVALFIGLDISTQASVFSVVNLAQTKVNASLVYDLFAYDKARSPEKTGHELAVALDATPDSPFFERIKRLGVATQGRFGETLSQATFVRSLLPYLTSDVLIDREIGKKGGRWPKPNFPEARSMIFRLFFVEGRDLDIAEVLWNYFSAVEDRWPESWNWLGTGRILNKTTGFQALMRFLGPAYRAIVGPGGKPTKAQFMAIFEGSKLKDGDFTSEVFKPGSSGVSTLFNRLVEETHVAR
jgi:DGQHR domain-containing protein